MKNKVHCQCRECDNYTFIDMTFEDIKRAWDNNYYSRCPNCKESEAEMYPIHFHYPDGRIVCIEDLMILGV